MPLFASWCSCVLQLWDPSKHPCFAQKTAESDREGDYRKGDWFVDVVPCGACLLVFADLSELLVPLNLQILRTISAFWDPCESQHQACDCCVQDKKRERWRPSSWPSLPIRQPSPEFLKARVLPLAQPSCTPFADWVRSFRDQTQKLGEGARICSLDLLPVCHNSSPIQFEDNYQWAAEQTVRHSHAALALENLGKRTSMQILGFPKVDLAWVEFWNLLLYLEVNPHFTAAQLPQIQTQAAVGESKTKTKTKTKTDAEGTRKRKLSPDMAARSRQSYFGEGTAARKVYEDARDVLEREAFEAHQRQVAEIQKLRKRADAEFQGALTTLESIWNFKAQKIAQDFDSLLRDLRKVKEAASTSNPGKEGGEGSVDRVLSMMKAHPFYFFLPDVKVKADLAIPSASLSPMLVWEPRKELFARWQEFKNTTKMKIALVVDKSWTEFKGSEIAFVPEADPITVEWHRITGRTRQVVPKALKYVRKHTLDASYIYSGEIPGSSALTRPKSRTPRVQRWQVKVRTRHAPQLRSSLRQVTTLRPEIQQWVANKSGKGCDITSDGLCFSEELGNAKLNFVFLKASAGERAQPTLSWNTDLPRDCIVPFSSPRSPCTFLVEWPEESGVLYMYAHPADWAAHFREEAALQNNQGQEQSKQEPKQDSKGVDDEKYNKCKCAHCVETENLYRDDESYSWKLKKPKSPKSPTPPLRWDDDEEESEERSEFLRFKGIQRELQMPEADLLGAWVGDQWIRQFTRWCLSSSGTEFWHVQVFEMGEDPKSESVTQDAAINKTSQDRKRKVRIFGHSLDKILEEDDDDPICSIELDSRCRVDELYRADQFLIVDTTFREREQKEENSDLDETKLATVFWIYRIFSLDSCQDGSLKASLFAKLTSRPDGAPLGPGGKGWYLTSVVVVPERKLIILGGNPTGVLEYGNAYGEFEKPRWRQRTGLYKKCSWKRMGKERASYIWACEDETNGNSWKCYRLGEFCKVYLS